VKPVPLGLEAAGTEPLLAAVKGRCACDDGDPQPRLQAQRLHSVRLVSPRGKAVLFVERVVTRGTEVGAFVTYTERQAG
jgi:hypothetical protein